MKKDKTRKDRFADARCPCKNEPIDKCSCKHCKISPEEEKELSKWLQKEFSKR